MKPYEVELLVAEVGHADDDHAEMYHVLYDGVVMDEQDYSVLGGHAEADHRGARRSSTPTAWSSATRSKLGAKLLGTDDESLAADQLEVALLDRARPRRAFRRIKNDELERTARRLTGRQYQRSTERDRTGEQHEQRSARRDPRTARHTAIADRRPIVVEDLVGFVDLGRPAAQARFVDLVVGHVHVDPRQVADGQTRTDRRARRAAARRSPRTRDARPCTCARKDP